MQADVAHRDTRGWGPGLVRVYAALLERPHWPALALALVTLLALWQASHLRIEVNLSGLIGDETQGAQAMRAYEARFAPIRAEEVLLVRAPGGFGSEAALADFESLILELQFVEGVEQVISLAALPAPGREGAWLSGPELASLPPAERLHRMRAENPLAAQLMSADLGAAVLAVVPGRGQGGARLAEAIDRAAALVPGLNVTNVGLSEVQRAIATELIRDLELLIPAAVLISLALSQMLFRDVRSVVVVALPPIVGLGWFLGALGALDMPFDPVMGALPVLLIVLGFSDSIHVFFAARHAVEGGAPRTAALARALAETTPAATLTSVTTMIAFASLLMPESPSLNAMAWAGVLGMVLTLAAVLTLSPVLMALLGVPRQGQSASRLFRGVLPLAQRIGRHGSRVALASGVLLVGLLAMQGQSRLGFRYSDYLPQGAAVTEALAAMETAGLGSDRMLLVIEADPGAPLANVRAAVVAIWGPGGADWTLGTSGEAMLARMAARDGAAHALPVQLAIAARDVPADQGLRLLTQRLQAAGLTTQAQIIGPGHALLTEGPRLVASLRWGLYTTILTIALLVALVYRSWRLALIALVVNLIPILGVEAWLALIGRELTIMNMIALTVAFGIAVDDTLHFLNRLRLARGSTAERVEQALDEAAPPMVATSAILLGGLVVTLASALPGLAVYGGLIALSVMLALAADLFLLPGLIRWSLR